MDKFEMLAGANAIIVELRRQQLDFSADGVRLDRDAASMTVQLLERLEGYLEDDPA